MKLLLPALALFAVIYVVGLPIDPTASLQPRKGGGGKGVGSRPKKPSGRTGIARGGNRDNSGGSTKTGSGPAPAYGRGRYYGGGASIPYKAGDARGGITAVLLVGSAVAFWPGLWMSIYVYDHTPYLFYNASIHEYQKKPVLCGCAEHQPCGCDYNNSTEYINSILGDGSYNGLNKSVVNIADYMGESTILINGTLPNGTTAAGGNDEVGSNAIRLAARSLRLAWVVPVVFIFSIV
ncbi:uncharacterized protein CTRU02_215619 [Colletotrichum truncatum]|uniref:Uncharacterized protein n=1 Tax=Colletotrichum truncatum TaxID=5467 RepID=A0ACC3YC59_COLTU|nr:uncharacterized protein CTRU02_05439 [Colletotrichum truncatum]KAF6793882.1 hypothetical protein CTRU02_05439 [Colletotrichum truncatum]